MIKGKCEDIANAWRREKGVGHKIMVVLAVIFSFIIHLWIMTFLLGFASADPKPDLTTMDYVKAYGIILLELSIFKIFTCI